ncbi:MAG: DNA polymerase III subunit alpha [Chthonomonas sp.]|nr:DNA polymerase III subunit alpha [Chthonomonas sp.]
MKSREVMAQWREIGEWWQYESPREITQFLDAKGIRREEIREFNPLALTPISEPEPEKHTEDWSLRIQKRRDEKVAQACGYLPPDPLDGPTTLIRSARPESVGLLTTLSGYSFGQSCMLAEEIPVLAAQADLRAIGLADRFSLCGAVEFTKRALSSGIKPLIGATIELPEGGSFALFARSKRGYSNLSQFITACHLEQPLRFPMATWANLARYAGDLVCLTGGHNSPVNLMLAHNQDREAEQWIGRMRELMPVWISIERSFVPWEMSVNRRLEDLAAAHSLTCVAGGLVTHARPEHFLCQDTLVCVESLSLVEEITGRKPRRDEHQPAPRWEAPQRGINAERYLRTAREMTQLFGDRPDLLANTLRFAELCDDDVLPSRTRLPQLYPDPVHALREITWAGAHARHPKITAALRKRLDFELTRICDLNFADHFLTMWDICQWSNEHGILFSGRGSVVDAAVSYCLGFSRIDAFAHRLHFDRFLPADGSKRPDIDVDFEAARREDVRTYVTKKYGVDRVATVAAVGTYGSRGIIREVGKVMGLPPAVIGFLAKKLHGGISPRNIESALENRPELRNSNIPRERFRWVMELAERMMDVPRNMRSHSSGVVISDRPMAETVPLQFSATTIDDDLGQPDPDEPAHLRIIQWDKRSAKHFFDKFDILCLRGQDVLSGTQTRLRVREPGFSVEQVPIDDEETYRAMRSGELIGIPQSASPAMRQAHIRMRTANLHDASLVQAGIRPGVGGAVKINELIARRRGRPFTYVHPDLEQILGLTYGLVVFQEQVDQLLQTFAGYSSGEAEDTREAIHKRRGEDYGRQIREQVMSRILGQGYAPAVAEHVFELVAAFKGYGFAQGHALAFAEVSIRSIYCQQNYPAEYFAALLSAQPAGYYGPCTIINEARSRGAAILPPCVQRSQLQFSVESVQSAMDPRIVLPNAGIRIGLMQIEGISMNLRQRILTLPEAATRSLFEFVRQVNPNRDELELLIMCGALDALHDNRRAMMLAIPDALEFAVRSGSSHQPALDLHFPTPPMPEGVADWSIAERAVFERRILNLDVHHHLMAFERERVLARGGLTTQQTKQLRPGAKAIVVGNPIRLRFPPTPSGRRVVFFDLEDETGLLNVTCFDETYRRDGHSIICSPYATLIGETQDRDGHLAFLAHRVFPYQPTLAGKLPEHQAIPIEAADFLVG